MEEGKIPTFEKMGTKKDVEKHKKIMHSFHHFEGIFLMQKKKGIAV